MGLFKLYQLLIALYFGGIRVASIFSKPARRFVKGRAHWQTQLKAFHAQHQNNPNRIWMHVASLGEFEQGRPVLERLKKEKPEYLIILSFFSPSGYDKQAHYPGADLVCYFPSDVHQTAASFISWVQPKMAIFVKYDFWFNTLQILRQKQIPFYFISSYFRPGHYLLKPFFKPLLDIVLQAEIIFVQDPLSQKMLLNANATNPVVVAGDTRIDRVLHIAQQTVSLESVENFCKNRKVLVAGSVWHSDLRRMLTGLKTLVQNEWHIVLAPHQLDHGELELLKTNFGEQASTLSEYREQADVKLLMIDRIGMLSMLYRYGQIAYIGGGFGKGIHNILEPAAYGIPILFGPRIDKFPEARALIELKSARLVNNSAEFLHAIDLLVPRLQEIRQNIHQYLKEQSGASERIYQYIKPRL